MSLTARLGSDDLGVRINVLPGYLLGRYGATTGEMSEQSVLRYREMYPNGLFITILAGPWIRLTGTPVAPTVLARAEGALAVKTAMLAVSDETYFIAPLGKLFLGSLDELNAEATRNGPEYHEAAASIDKHSTTKLVTSSRRSDQLLGPFSAKINEMLRQKPRTDVSDLALPQHLVLSYEKEYASEEQELYAEFPIPELRSPQFLRYYFVAPARP